MNEMLSLRRFTLRIALGVIAGTAVLVATAYGGTPSTSRAPKGALVALRKTTLGSVLVDARGRTLYLFEKDRNGVSACVTACVKSGRRSLVEQGHARARECTRRCSVSPGGRTGAGR